MKAISLRTIRRRQSPPVGMAAAALAAALGLGATGGCQLVGGAIANYERTGSRTVEAQYLGLEGKSFAVIVTADRSIQADFPGLVEVVSQRVTERLCAPTNLPRAGGYVPADQVLAFQSRNPAWVSRPMGEMAKELGGVQRIVMIEIYEYRLNEPGNAYEWDGTAAANVSVIETDGPMEDDFAFQRSISVKFPDQKGTGPTEITQTLVNSALASRLVDRASWLFYRHEELNALKY